MRLNLNNIYYAQADDNIKLVIFIPVNEYKQRNDKYGYDAEIIYYNGSGANKIQSKVYNTAGLLTNGSVPILNLIDHKNKLTEILHIIFKYKNQII